MFLPVCINITNKRILLVGGGKVAAHKAELLLRFAGGEQLFVLSPEFAPETKALPLQFIQKEYETTDLVGYFLVYICTDNHALNQQIKRDAEQLGILANVCDKPALCDFISPAIYQDGNMTVAVSSGGTDVRRAIALRDEIKKQFLS